MYRAVYNTQLHTYHSQLSTVTSRLTVLHTENVARGGKLSFQKVGGAKVLTLQKSRGGKSSLRGEKAPTHSKSSAGLIFTSKKTLEHGGGPG